VALAGLLLLTLTALFFKGRYHEQLRLPRFPRLRLLNR
jgi:hypothetical protein